MIIHYSEKFDVAFGLISTKDGTILMVKNVHVSVDCHLFCEDGPQVIWQANDSERSHLLSGHVFRLLVNISKT